MFVFGDLKRIIDLAKLTCSDTLKNQIIETSNSLSRIELRIVEQFIDNGLYGLHQTCDSNGNLLDWNGATDDFEGIPQYVSEDTGAYSRALITVYIGNLGANCNSSGIGNARNLGINLSLLVVYYECIVFYISIVS